MKISQRLASLLALAAVLFSTSLKAEGRVYPTSDLNDPLANKERRDVSWGGVQCAVNTLVLTLSGGTIAAALTPDMSNLLFGLIREEIEADPASFALPMPIGQLQDAFHLLLERVSQNPGLIANTALVTLMSKGGGPGAMGGMKLFSDIAVIRTLAECGITLYRGVVQLSKDIPALVKDVKAMRASQIALNRRCADYEGYTACNRNCLGTRPALERWIPNCSRHTDAYPEALNEIAVGLLRACHQDFCASPRHRWNQKKLQCRLDGVSAEALGGRRTSACSRISESA